MAVSGIALWLNTVFANFDASIAVAIHTLYTIGGGFFTPFFKFISFLGKDGIILILLSLGLMFFQRTRRFGTAMLLSLIVDVLLVNCCLKIIIARPRPYVDTDSVFYNMWLTVGQCVESDKSFPSGHTAAAFATMTAVFLVGDKRVSWTAFIFGVLMGISRIYLCVHYPTDVVGGMIAGVIAGTAGYFLYVIIPAEWYDIDFIDYGKAFIGSRTVKGRH